MGAKLSVDKLGGMVMYQLCDVLARVLETIS